MCASAMPGNRLHCFNRLLRELVVVRTAARHLQINGRGQTEVQNLVGDVGRREEEGGRGKIRVQIGAQFAHVKSACSRLAGLQRDQDVAVGIGRRSRWSLKARLMPPLGSPMLSRMSLIWSGRNDVTYLLLDGGKVLLGIFGRMPCGG